MKKFQAIVSILLCSLASIATSFAQNHGSVYSRPERLGAVLSTQPGKDAFVRIFEGRLPNMEITETRALELANASTEFANQGSLNADNTSIAAGFTFLGQFLDHDMTLNNGALKIVSGGVPALLGVVAAAPLASTAVNQRSGSFDLDSVYGNSGETVVAALRSALSAGVCVPPTPASGCVDPNSSGTRFLALYEFDSNHRPTGRFLIGKGLEDVADLPRCFERPWAPQCPQATPATIPPTPIRPNAAILGDGRNDENVIVAQLHLLFLKAHNRLYELSRGVAPNATVTFNEEAFRFARRMLVEHYHSIIRDEYVPLTIGSDRAAAIGRNGFRFYSAPGSEKPHCSDDVAQIPHEFAIAAFRFGHSQVRPGYALNATSGSGFSGLFGDQRVGAQRKIDWERFFDMPERVPLGSANPRQASKRIDTIVSRPLAAMPVPAIDKEDALAQGETLSEKPLASLPIRNTARASRKETGPNAPKTDRMVDRFPVAGGLSIATAMSSTNPAFGHLGIVPLTQEQLDQTALNRADRVAGPLNNKSAKLDELLLWVYVLAEAEAMNGGASLGPVGGTIVGEVFLGLLACDDAGISKNPFWRPTIPSVQAHRFTMGDLVRFVEK